MEDSLIGFDQDYSRSTIGVKSHYATNLCPIFPRTIAMMADSPSSMVLFADPSMQIPEAIEQFYLQAVSSERHARCHPEPIQTRSSLTRLKGAYLGHLYFVVLPYGL
jgi:hypothetical protein